MGVWELGSVWKGAGAERSEFEERRPVPSLITVGPYGACCLQGAGNREAPG